jgi:uncharacterized RDD family membrane protein YckC
MTLPPMNSQWPPADLRDGRFPSSRTRPWRRFFARHIDIVLIALAVTGLGSLVFEPRGDVDRLLGSEIWAPMIYLLVLVPVEVALLSTIGTTPGKWLYAIHLKAKDGKPITLQQAATRTFTVYWKGMGLNVPIVSLICMAIAHTTLTRNGRTSWDLEIAVTHSGLEIWRIVAIVAVWIAILYVIFIDYLR